MEEEFHESEVVFSEIYQLPNTLRNSGHTSLGKKSSKTHRNNINTVKSMPEICQLSNNLRDSADHTSSLEENSSKKHRKNTGAVKSMPEICQLPNSPRDYSKKHRKNPKTLKSMPLDIPGRDSFRYVDVIEYNNKDGDYDDYEDDDDETRLPPHLIIARRIRNWNHGESMACSYCIEDGNGRILKGRNLFQVRNSILRLTGFIET